MKKDSSARSDGLRVRKRLLDVTFICFISFFLIIVMALLMLIYSSSTLKNNGIAAFGPYTAIRNTEILKSQLTASGKTELANYDYMQFKNKGNYKVGEFVAYTEAHKFDDPNDNDNYGQTRLIVQFGKITNIKTITHQNGTQEQIVSIFNPKTATQEISSKNILGNFNGQLNTQATKILSNPRPIAYICLIPTAVLTIIVLLSYISILLNKDAYLKMSTMSGFENMYDLGTIPAAGGMGPNPSGVNDIDEDTEESIEEEQQDVERRVKLNSIDALNKEQIKPLLNENYYSNIVSDNNNQLYQKIDKFKDAISNLNEVGASDMDIIKINMYGNDEFDKLLETKRTGVKAFDIIEIIKFLNSLPDVHCIKKVGRLNWTYKYKSKTFAIIREDANKVYRISFKLYPDAADKLNNAFMAFEDSTFPAGPYWFMVNNLRNVPIEVIKWSLKESHRISELQEIRYSFLREDEQLSNMISDQEDKLIKAVNNKDEITVFDKFAAVIHNPGQEDPLDCYLKNKSTSKLKIDDYNKELYFPLDNSHVLSILLEKRIPEQLATALSSDLLDVVKPNNSILNARSNSYSSNATRQQNTNIPTDIQNLSSQQQEQSNNGVVIRRIDNSNKKKKGKRK